MLSKATLSARGTSVKSIFILSESGWPTKDVGKKLGRMSDYSMEEVTEEFGSVKLLKIDV